jgi:hypothetical protein
MTDRGTERFPGAIEQGFDAGPLGIGDGASGVAGVAQDHGFGSRAGVVLEHGGGLLEDGGLQRCEGALEIGDGIASALAVDDPPFDFQPGDLVYGEGHVAAAADEGVIADETGEGQLVAGAPVSPLEYDRRARGVVRTHARGPEREVVLGAEQFGQLGKEGQALVGVVGAPHGGFQASDLAGIEVGKVVAAGGGEVRGDPDEPEKNRDYEPGPVSHQSGIRFRGNIRFF